MLKNTKTRAKVIEIFENSNTPLNANEIYEKLKDNKITLSSIYRTLDAFTKEHLIIKDSDPKGTAIYTLHKVNHTHFLECKSCHRKIELDYCPYHKANDKISKSYNFEPDENNIIIYGTCKNCKHK